MKSLRRLVVNWKSVESQLWRSNGSSIVSTPKPDAHSILRPARPCYNQDLFNSPVIVAH